MKKAIPNQSLKHAREQQGWSQQYVAEQIGARAASYVSRWERGIVSPTPYYRQRLCKLFSMTAEQLGLIHTTDYTYEQTPNSLPLDRNSANHISTNLNTDTTSLSQHIWNVPQHRNPFFTGREDILQKLHDMLMASKFTALTQHQALSGLGGIGKTQTAAEYCYRYRDCYQFVLWIRADTHETLIADFEDIANLLKLPERIAQDHDIIVRAVKNWLETNTDWLLVFDNVDDLTIINDFLPTSDKGHIILTTRITATGAIAHSIELEKMSHEEGALLLLRRAKILTSDTPLDHISDTLREDAEALSQVMDGLPLALDQAGAYIEGTGRSLSDYLKLFQERGMALLKQPDKLASDYPQSVTNTWSLSFEKVERANPAAAELLWFCAFLYPDTIPEEVIIEGAPELGPILQHTAADPLELDAAIEELRKFSFLHRYSETRSISVHRLVQAVLKNGLDKEHQRLWAERAVLALNRVFPDVNAASLKQCHRYLPHSLVCAQLIKDWSISSVEAARLLHMSARSLYYLAQYAQAELLFKQVLKMYESLSTLDSLEYSDCLNDLAELYQEQDRYSEAQPLYEHSIALVKAIAGDTSPSYAMGLNNLAMLYDLQAKYDQALPLFQKAIAIYRTVPTSSHIELAYCLNNIGLSYLRQGNPTVAEPFFREAIAIGEMELGSEQNHDLATWYNNLAIIYMRQKEYAKAIPLLQQANAMYIEGLGKEHPLVAVSLNNLGNVYFEQGDYDKALPLFEQALSIRLKALGQKHHLVAQSINKLGRVNRDLGKYEDALPLFEQAITIGLETLGPEHPDVAIWFHDLGKYYHKIGNYVKAEEFYNKALEIWRKSWGLEHHTVIDKLNDLAALYVEQGKYAEAEALYREVPTMLRSNL